MLFVCSSLLTPAKATLESVPKHDQVAEWLRRWTANPMGFPRVSSNLILIESLLLHFGQAYRVQPVGQECVLDASREQAAL